MIASDVNVFVDAYRTSSPHHEQARGWLTKALVGDEPFGIWEVTLVSVYRIMTDGRIWTDPETPEATLAYLDGIRSAPAVAMLAPGPIYWSIFDRLCREANVKGPLTSDAMLAALAIEHRCRLATFDKDFAKFRGLAVFRPTP